MYDKNAFPKKCAALSISPDLFVCESKNKYRGVCFNLALNNSSFGAGNGKVILKLNNESKFIFKHEGDYKPITKNLPDGIQIIKPDNKEIGIFDYLYTIERAYQVHVANSSFMNLIDCIQLRTEGLFYHEYSRPNINTILKLPWIILK